ncbi:MAG: response regulator [Oscillospiraceae bacterium]|jgi:PAS domain S-box-containing protein|nr:response regulator [Oscillospiraceae bacterium]
MLTKRGNSKLFFVLTLVFIFALIAIILITQNVTSHIVNELTMERAVAAKTGLQGFFQELEERAAQWADAISTRALFREAIQGGDHEVIQSFMKDFTDSIDFLSVTDKDGIIIARSYNDERGDDVSGQREVAIVLETEKNASGMSFIPDSKSPDRRLAINASAPVFDNDGNIIAIVNCNFDITDSRHLNTFKDRTGCDASLFIGTTRTATTIKNSEGYHIISEEAVDTIFNQKAGSYTGMFEIYGHTYAAQYSPLIFEDEIVGMMFTGVQVDSVIESRRDMNFWIFIVTIFCIIIMGAFVFASGRYSRTLQELTAKTVQLDNMERLLQSMDTMIVITELESDIITFINETMIKGLGFDEDVVGKECWKVFAPGATGRCSFCPKNDPEFKEGKPYQWEFYNSALCRHFKIISRLIDWPDGTKVFIEQCEDITEAKEAVNKMREADVRLKLMLDALPMSSSLWDEDFNFISCNPETLNLFGMSSEEEYRKEFFLLSPKFQKNSKPSREMTMYWVKKAFDEGYVKFEWTHKNKNGEIIPCEVMLVRMKYKDNYLIVSYIRDLREQTAHLEEMNRAQEDLRSALRAAEAANLAKSIFLANMSHEIRTPLNSIIGFSELALDGDISLETNDYIGKIMDNGELLLHIINNILDISKIESGKMVLEHIPFNLHDIFTHCQAAIMPKTTEKGIALYCYAEPSIGKRLLGDPIKLRQALTNMLSNAVKFTNIGTVKLLASVNSLDTNSVNIHFEIKDSGIGMTSEQISNIFEPFLQADNSITRKFGGTGLGLSITKNIIEMMGGKLLVESTPGIGSKFSFDLTFETINEAVELPVESIVIDEMKKPEFEGEVLVCEDNSMNQQVICGHLTRVGLKSVVATNGKEGTEIIQKRMSDGVQPFALIFMDIHMPVMDGMEAAAKIVALGCKTPIVAMTANIMSNDLELYKKNGILDYIGKPFKSQELWKCLTKYIPVVKLTDTDKRRQESDDEKMQKYLKLNFVKNNQTKLKEIMENVESGDIRMAHRLVHTLKSNAGQIGKHRLQQAAGTAEDMLKGGENRLSEKHIAALDAELKLVLAELKPLLSEFGKEGKSGSSEPGAVRDLLGRLETMLASNNPECMMLLDQLSAVPEAEELIGYVEDFEFKKAMQALDKLKKRMDIS